MSRTAKQYWITAVFCIGLAAPAFADGLQRFEQVIKPTIPAGALTYGSASAIGDRGFMLQDVVLTPPAEPGKKPDMPVRIRAITVEDIDFDAIAKSLPPDFAKLRIEGIAIESGTIPDLDMKGFFGTDRMTAELVLDYRTDTKTETMTLSRLELRLDGLGRLEFSMVMDGVTPSAAAAPDAKDKASLRIATLTYDDQSLMNKLFTAFAASQQMAPELLVAGFTTLINAERAGASPLAVAAMDAVSAFAEDFKQPKGALRININPPTALKAANLPDSPTVTDGLLKSLGLTVSYSATRPWKGPTVTLPPGAVAAPAAGGTCASGTRYFALEDNGWHAVTAREASASGRDCIVRPDGGGPGDDMVVKVTDLIAWSMDGPGRPAGRCQKGDKVLAESDGVWYPGTVKAAQLRNGKCPIRFDDFDEDEDEDVTLARMRVMAR